jgi:hypothetical protein
MRGLNDVIAGFSVPGNACGINRGLTGPND